MAVMYPPTPSILGELFGDIEREAAMVPLSRTSSRSSGTSYSTIPGIGMVSGKAIMALGQLAIRGVGVANLQLAFARISRQLRSKDSYLAPKAAENLLELQRVGLYGVEIHRRAWDLIILALGHPNRQAMKQIAQALRSWSTVDFEFFLRQLIVCKISNWTRTPGNLASYPENGNEWSPGVNAQHLDDSLHELLLVMLERDSSLLRSSETIQPRYFLEALLYVMEKRQTSRIPFMHWKERDLIPFLSHLEELRMDGWGLNLDEDLHNDSSSTLSQSPLHPDLITQGYYDILVTVMTKYPIIPDESCTGPSVSAMKLLFSILEQEPYCVDGMVEVLVEWPAKDLRRLLFKFTELDLEVRNFSSWSSFFRRVVSIICAKEPSFLLGVKDVSTFLDFLWNPPAVDPLLTRTSSFSELFNRIEPFPDH